MSEIENTPYERLKALQHEIQLERGRKPPIKDLIVLASQNDPFYAGTERQRAMAEWFAGVFGQTTGVH
jgi:predicted alpha/beta hydrolase family esterase